MSTVIRPPLLPMEAKSVDEIPVGPGWQYEPKWDGFRCLAFRRGKDIYLQSKSGQPLARYFPDIVVALLQLAAKKLVLDGELVIDVDGRFSFDELQLRLHPAASRVQKLAAGHPATFVVFDLLENDAGKSLLKAPLHERRIALEKFATKNLKSAKAIKLSPATTSLLQAKKWVQESRWQSRWRHRQASRFGLRPGRTHCDDESEKHPHRRLRGRRVSLRQRLEINRIAFTWSLRRCRPVTSRRVHFRF